MYLGTECSILFSGLKTGKYVILPHAYVHMYMYIAKCTCILPHAYVHMYMYIAKCTCVLHVHCKVYMCLHVHVHVFACTVSSIHVLDQCVVVYVHVCEIPSLV